jgi:polyhydroxybutyrate depolymerase
MKPAFLVVCALALACGASTSGPSSPSDPPPSDPGEPSGGCASWTLTRGVSTGTIQVGGIDRTYVLSVPSGTNGPVPVVFAFHGSGDSGGNFRGWFGGGLERSASEPTIFAYPDALPVGGTGAPGWDDAGGRDTAFFDALLGRIEAGACVATARVFVTGFSYGGFMSNTLGCKRAGVVRAIAPLSGGGPWGGCNGQRVAAWVACGDTDSLLTQSEGSRDHWAAASHCGAGTSAVSPSPCVAYAGCDGGYPVVWCPFTGGHTVQSWEAPAVMQFFAGLP